jgi:hypothetical protein
VIRQHAPKAQDFTNRRYRHRGGVDEVERAKNRTKSQVRARVEHSIGVIKRVFLDLGGVHRGSDQQTAGIGHNMALAPSDPLGRIVTSRPAALGRLDRLTVDHPRRRARLAAGRFGRLQHQHKIDLLEQVVVAPEVEIIKVRLGEPSRARNNFRAHIEGKLRTCP